MALLKSTGSKKVNLDFNKEFINTFSDNIENRNIDFINKTLKDLHEADIANLIENLNPDTRTKLIEIESFNIEQENLVLKNEFWYSTTPIIGIKYTRLSVMVKQPM